MGRKAHPLAARIKKMMQTDEDVGKIAQATPIMIARAMELFLGRLCQNAAEVATNRKAKTLTTSHLKAYVSSDELMDFLKDTVQKAPDLPEGDADAPKPKRQRTEGKREPRASAEGKRGSADGAAAAPKAAAGAAASNAAAGAAAAAADTEHVKQEETDSPSAHAAHAKLGHGFGGLGTHPFLASRSFGSKASGAAAKRRPGSSSISPKPESPSRHQHQDKQQAAEDEGAPEQDVKHEQELEQQPEQQQQFDQAAGEFSLPGLPGMLSVQALASFQQQDDFDEDYDS